MTDTAQIKLTKDEVQAFNRCVRLEGTSEEKRQLQEALVCMTRSPKGLASIRNFIRSRKSVTLGILPEEEALDHNAISATNRHTGKLRFRETLRPQQMAWAISQKFDSLSLQTRFRNSALVTSEIMPDSDRRVPEAQGRAM